MCGIATLAIVVSRICSSEAIMIPMTTNTVLRVGSAATSAIALAAAPAAGGAAEPSDATLAMFG